jgi:formimidoylglutamate deiminase
MNCVSLNIRSALAHRSRNVLAAPGQSTGRALFDGAVDGGGIALAAQTGIAAGNPADFVSLRAPDGDLADDVVLDSWLFANGTKPDSVWVAGRKQVEGGRHHKRDEISARFRSVMRELLA